MNRKILMILAVSVIMTAVALGAIAVIEKSIRASQISSFEECAKQGYPVSGSIPRQCRVSNNVVFNEKIEPIRQAEKVSIPDQEERTSCVSSCGNDSCEEVVCQGTGCPCAETAESCPEDCHQNGNQTPVPY